MRKSKVLDIVGLAPDGRTYLRVTYVQSAPAVSFANQLLIEIRPASPTTGKVFQTDTNSQDTPQGCELCQIGQSFFPGDFFHRISIQAYMNRHKAATQS